jgi:hypothetical protein
MTRVTLFLVSLRSTRESEADGDESFWKVSGLKKTTCGASTTASVFLSLKKRPTLTAVLEALCFHFPSLAKKKKKKKKKD